MLDRLRRFAAPVLVGVAAVLVLAGAALVVALRPAGAPSPSEAATKADGTDAGVLASMPWGKGRLVLTGRDGTAGDRHLTLAFVADMGRGWRVVASAEQSAALTDVRVGSLLVTRSDGGAGQPPWSAVYGELGDANIQSVAITWNGGEISTAKRSGSAYLVVRRGANEAIESRYLAADGAEIARVPILEENA